jgi:hypothetical protein
MSNRREIRNEYKARRRRGGVYTITNVVSGRYIIGYAADIASVRNHFEFAVTTGSAVHPKLRQDWAESGPRAFVLEVREELEQGPDQSQAEFLDDLKLLEHLWRTTLDASKEY